MGKVSFSPLTTLKETKSRNELCVSHARWTVKDGKCLTAAQKYDSTNKECRTSWVPSAADALRKFHNGEMTRAEIEKELEDYR